MRGGIYQIINKINGKSYIGLSNNIKRRECEHKTPKNVKNRTNAIYRAIRKYSIENFMFKVLEYVDDNSKLAEREVFWIAKLKPEYNMNLGGNGNKGHKLSDELKTRLREIGKNQWLRKSRSEKERIIRNNLKGPRQGHAVSIETRDKLREINKGKKQSKETIEKRSLKMKGVHKPNLHHYKKVRSTKDMIEYVYYNSIKDAAKFHNVSPSNISAVLIGKQKTSRGLYWEYV